MKRNLLHSASKLAVEWPTHLPGLLLLSPPTFPALLSLWLFSPLSSLWPLGLPICLCLCLGTLPFPLFNQLIFIHSAHLTSLSWVVVSEDNSSELKSKVYYFLSMPLLSPKSQLPSCKTGMNTSTMSNSCCKAHMSMVYRELWKRVLITISKGPPSTLLGTVAIIHLCYSFIMPVSPLQWKLHGAEVCKGIVHIIDSASSRKILKYLLKNKWMKMLSIVPGTKWSLINTSF